MTNTKNTTLEVNTEDGWRYVRGYNTGSSKCLKYALTPGNVFADAIGDYNRMFPTYEFRVAVIPTEFL